MPYRIPAPDTTDWKIEFLDAYAKAMRQRMKAGELPEIESVKRRGEFLLITYKRAES